jgi:NitT/TauT family transport system ATP-binding protein
MNDKPLSLINVSHAYDANAVFEDLSLAIERGEFVAVVGPSGCGKTTLLNLLSGFLRPTSGIINRAGRTRMVYQSDGLFPWLTVKENIALGLRHLVKGNERQAQLQDLLNLIRLDGFAQHYPHQLSGGMRRMLVRVLTERPRTVVFVTHDIEEAAQLADRILVLSERPARLINELRVNIERPRDLTHPTVVGTVKTILDELGLREGAPEFSTVK